MPYVAYNEPENKLLIGKHHKSRSLRAAHRIIRRKEKKRAGK